MSAAEEQPQGVATVGKEKQDPAATPTVVVISSSNGAENILARFKGDSFATDSAAESQGSMDATDLTRDQWIKILWVTNMIDTLH